MKNNYTYPARITKEDGSLVLRFIDFEDIEVFDDDMESLITSAQEQLALYIIDCLDCGREVPKEGEYVEGATYVNIWLPYYRTQVKEVYVKKTLTIPSWLDILAKEKDINFSATLVKGLKEELGLEK